MLIEKHNMTLEDEFCIIRRVDADPYPPTSPLQQILHEVEGVIHNMGTCLVLQEYYVLQDDGRIMLFFGWFDMDIVEYVIFSYRDARRVVGQSFVRKETGKGERKPKKCS